MNRVALTAAVLAFVSTSSAQAQTRTKVGSSFAPTTYEDYAKSRSTMVPLTYDEYAARVRNGYRPTPSVSYSEFETPPGGVLFGAPAPTIPDAAQAVVTMRFPAAAEVWLNGYKCEGSPSREWVFTSPTLPGGTAFLFDVRARWTSGGQTYETERSVAVFSGSRSRTTVLSGRVTPD